MRHEELPSKLFLDLGTTSPKLVPGFGALPEGLRREPGGRQTPSPGRQPWDKPTNGSPPCQGRQTSPLAGFKSGWGGLRFPGLLPWAGGLPPSGLGVSACGRSSPAGTPDYADHDRIWEMTLSEEEFLRRFLRHVLSDGFVRIRY
jgi:putative transposase